MNFWEFYRLEICDDWYLNEVNTPTDGDWRDRKIWHITSTGQRNRIMVKSLPANQQWAYAPLDVKLKLKSQGKKVSVSKPGSFMQTDEEKRLFTVYYAGDRPNSFDSFEAGKLVVGTDDSARAIEIENAGHKVAIAKKVPLDAFVKFMNMNGDWENFPDKIDDEHKFELIKFTDGDLYLLDFNKFKDQIIFSLSDERLSDEKDFE